MASGIPPKRKGEKAPKTDAEPTYRMSMLPFGTYANPDGTESLGLALPGMLHEPLMAAERLFGTPSNPGTFTQGPDVPGNADDMRTLLLSMYGGNAMNPAAVIPKGALASGVVREAAETAPIRAYRGKADARSLFPEPPSPDKLYTGQPEMVWGSSSPDVAGTYAGIFDNGFGVSSDDLTQPFVGAVAPVDLRFENPMRIDAQGRSWNNIPDPNGGAVPLTTDALANHALQNGHDGLIVQNVLDRAGGKIGDPATTYAAIRRGTVTSPLTGETLFSDTGKPSLMGSAVAGAEANSPIRAFHATNADFDKFDPAFTDEVGFHFGDKGTANNRAYIRSNGNPFSYMKYRNIPVEMDVQNPAALSRDVTPNYSGLPLAKQLVSDGIAPKSLLDDLAGKPQPEQNATVRNWLVDNGYDAVKYPNQFEGGGKPSYMALGTGNVKHAKTGATLYSEGSLPGSFVADPDDDDPNAPASIRYNNPGAQWPGQSSSRFGADGSATIGGGNKIAIFSDPVHGGAAQFDLLSRNYAGLPLSDAIKKWSGGNASDAYVANIVKRTGLSPDTVLSPELLSDSSRAIPLAKAMAAHEAGQDYPMSDDQWGQAFQLANGGQDVLTQPRVGMLSGMPGAVVANPNPNAPQMALPAGLLAGMDMTGAAPQTAPQATPAPAAGNSIMQGLIQGDKDAIAAMPKMDDFQFQAPQRAPIDLSRLAAIAQARQLGSRA